MEVPLRETRYNTRDELIRAIRRGGQNGTSTEMDALMVYDTFQRLAKGDK